jgi:hypothetical protein
MAKRLQNGLPSWLVGAVDQAQVHPFIATRLRLGCGRTVRLRAADTDKRLRAAE